MSLTRGPQVSPKPANFADAFDALAHDRPNAANELAELIIERASWLVKLAQAEKKQPTKIIQ